MYKKITVLALTAALLTGPALAAQAPQFLVPEGNYTDVYPYSEGYAVVTKNLTPGAAFPTLHYGLIDWDGKEVIAPRRGAMAPFQCGKSMVAGRRTLDDGYETTGIGFMDHSFQTVIPTVYEDASSDEGLYEFRDGMAQVMVTGTAEFALVDRDGNVVHTSSRSPHPINGIQIENPFRAYFGGGSSDTEQQNYVGIVETYLDPVTGERKTPTERLLPGRKTSTLFQNGEVIYTVGPQNSTTNRYYIPNADGSVSLFDLSDDPDFIYHGDPVIDGMTLVYDREGKIGIAKVDGAMVVPCQFDKVGWREMIPSVTVLNRKLVGIRDGVPVCFDLEGNEYYPFLSKYQGATNIILDQNGKSNAGSPYFRISFTSPADGSSYTVYVDLEGNEAGLHDINVDEDKYWAQQWGLEEGWEIYNYYRDYNSGLLRVWNPSKRLVSYYDLKGNIVLEPVEFLPPEIPYDRDLNPSVGPFRQGRAWFQRPDGKWVFLLHPDWVSQDAALSPCKITVDGQSVDFNAYLMKNSNYFKLRDLAMALKGTPAEFSVEYEVSSGVTYLRSTDTYAPVGGELAAGDGVPLKWAMPTHAGLYVNGQDPDLLGFTIGQNNYYKLRDIAKLLNINVTWDQTTGTVAIDTGTAYHD